MGRATTRCAGRILESARHCCRYDSRRDRVCRDTRSWRSVVVGDCSHIHSASGCGSSGGRNSMARRPVAGARRRTVGRWARPGNACNQAWPSRRRGYIARACVERDREHRRARRDRQPQLSDMAASASCLAIALLLLILTAMLVRMVWRALRNFFTGTGVRFSPRNDRKTTA